MAPNLGGLFCPASVGRQAIRASIFANNAFLPQSPRTAMAANNIGSFTMGRAGHSSDLAGDSFTRNTGKTRSGNARPPNRRSVRRVFKD